MWATQHNFQQLYDFFFFSVRSCLEESFFKEYYSSKVLWSLLRPSQSTDVFHQGLNIISPRTHFLLRFEGSELTIFPCCERKARYSTSVLLVTNKYCSCWIGVRDQHGCQLPINHQHTSYMKLSVHCAFEKDLVGLRFVFDALTTVTRQEFDKNENNQYPWFDEFTAHNLSWFARKSTVKKYVAPQDSTSNSRRPLTRGVQSSHWLLHNREADESHDMMTNLACWVPVFMNRLAKSNFFEWRANRPTNTWIGIVFTLHLNDW
jgi:hypothetical protein